MTASNIGCLALAALMITAILICGNQVSAQSCQGDVQGLIAQCSQYIQKSGPKKAPGQGCCNVLKKTNIPCVCKYVTKATQQLISMEKVIYVGQYCGKTVPHGFKCGSYTVPKA